MTLTARAVTYVILAVSLGTHTVAHAGNFDFCGTETRLQSAERSLAQQIVAENQSIRKQLLRDKLRQLVEDDWSKRVEAFGSKVVNPVFRGASPTTVGISGLTGKLIKLSAAGSDGAILDIKLDCPTAAVYIDYAGNIINAMQNVNVGDSVTISGTLNVSSDQWPETWNGNPSVSYRLITINDIIKK